MKIWKLRAACGLVLTLSLTHCVEQSGGSGGMGGTAGTGGSAEACGSPSSAFAVCGTIKREAPPDGSRVLVIWAVDPSGYKFGEGTTSGDQYVVEFESAPPAAALFGGILGIGIVLIVPPQLGDLPDGPLEQGFDPLSQSWLALGVTDAIIYRTSGSLVDWDLAFPPNDYACGGCIFLEQGFDEFEPFDCEDGLDLQGSSNPGDLVYLCDFT